MSVSAESASPREYFAIEPESAFGRMDGADAAFLRLREIRKKTGRVFIGVLAGRGDGFRATAQICPVQFLSQSAICRNIRCFLKHVAARRRPPENPPMQGICFRARRIGNGQNGDGRGE